MKSLFRSLNFAGWIIAINLGHAQSFAESPNFANELKNIICSKEIKTSLGPKLMRQTWVPELVSVPSKPLMTGISFRDTQKRVYYRVYAQKKQVNLVVGDYKTKIETLKTWDGQNKCHLETSTQPIPSSVLTIKTGFTDQNLFQTLKAHPWGVIYVWTPYMPLSVQGLKEIKAAVKAKGGSLTVLLDPKANLDEAKKWLGKGAVMRI